MMKTILVVENDPALRMLTSQLLELEGYKVIQAENGRLALEAIAAEPPDLVLCDLLMPELNGWEVLRQLMQSPETATIPLVFLTASAAPSEREACLSEGASGFIIKPFQHAELLQTIRSLLVGPAESQP
ncbi:response regulator [Methylocaldum sp. 14B]|uniref:response regulator n=1 Tax=unclassified Methylocaldum TaxID=2622260 RepID=UPI000989F952|nr:response regulator [Methylocaldum sp. 14B]